MSADEWDAEDFEPSLPSVGAGDKWEGEDEPDEIKDAWDNEDEKKAEDGASDDGTVKAVQRKKKKPLAERIAEKEAARQLKEAQEKEENRELSKDEKQAEADRIRKIQEEADLILAKEAFGVSESQSGLDAMFPSTEEEFVTFKDALKTKISSFKKSSDYGAFIDKLIQDLIVDLNVEDTKKVNGTVSSIYHEKQRLQKEQDKKKKKGKGKGVVKAERDTDFNDLAVAGQGGYDDSFYEDDFI